MNIFGILQAMNAKVTINAVHPGIVKTGIIRDHTGLITGTIYFWPNFIIFFVPFPCSHLKHKYITKSIKRKMKNNVYNLWEHKDIVDLLWFVLEARGKVCDWHTQYRNSHTINPSSNHTKHAKFYMILERAYIHIRETFFTFLCHWCTLFF